MPVCFVSCCSQCDVVAAVVVVVLVATYNKKRNDGTKDFFSFDNMKTWRLVGLCATF